MDGAVPAMYALILLGAYIGGALSVVVGTQIVYRHSTNTPLRRWVRFAALADLVVVGSASVFTAASLHTIIGYGSVKYVVAILFIVAVVLFRAVWKMQKSNKQFNEDA